MSNTHPGRPLSSGKLPSGRRRRRAAGFVLVVIALLYAGAAAACSCMAFPADEAEAAAMAYGQADAVFFGRVNGIKTGVPGLVRFRSVSFDVDRAWKGIDDDVEAIVQTATNSAACGYNFQRGERYLVFAYRHATDGTLSTNLCALNRPAGEAAGLMRELDALQSAPSSAAPQRAEMPGNCAAMLEDDDIFEDGLESTRDDMNAFAAYVGEFHSNRETFDDGETEYYFALRYDWYDDAKTTLKYSVAMVIPGQDREVIQSEGFYGYDPFDERIYVAGGFKRLGLSFAVLEHSDPVKRQRRMLGRIQRPDGTITLVSDQFQWLDGDTFRNRAFTCTTESREWTKVYEGTYTRQ